jgi:hypothetical protein
MQQEQTQQKSLGDLLRRAGREDIPPCQYSFPDNTTEGVLLMNALKSIEIGLHVSMADSLFSTDASAAVMLSSIATVAARQDALLRAYANSSTSLASFDTPLSDVWAYNLALGFVRPGSCTVELPIPVLPTLSLNNNTAGFAQPGTSITLAWDAAARATALRSGKPLFIGWINQVNAPVYTPLTLMEDGLGRTDVPLGLFGTAFAVMTTQPGLSDISDLTEATVAGPVIIYLL